MALITYSRLWFWLPSPHTLPLLTPQWDSSAWHH
jgi:hypothetical protein